MCSWPYLCGLCPGETALRRLPWPHGGIGVLGRRAGAGGQVPAAGALRAWTCCVVETALNVAVAPAASQPCCRLSVPEPPRSLFGSVLTLTDAVPIQSCLRKINHLPDQTCPVTDADCAFRRVGTRVDAELLTLEFASGLFYC